jgi:hypothetical protein
MRAHEFINEGLEQLVPLAAKGAWNLGKRGVGKLKNLISPAEPAVKNIVVPPPAEANILTGRTPATPKDITHAYRNMNQKELQAAQQSGYFEKNPDSTVAKGWDSNSKHWSSGDAEGHFGRDWKNASDNVKVRVPIDKVPGGTAVDAKYAEVLNKETGEWIPVVRNNTP